MVVDEVGKDFGEASLSVTEITFVSFHPGWTDTELDCKLIVLRYSVFKMIHKHLEVVIVQTLVYR